MKHQKYYVNMFLTIALALTCSQLLMGESRKGDKMTLDVPIDHQNDDSKKMGRSFDATPNQKNVEVCTIDINMTEKIQKIVSEALDPLCFGLNKLQNVNVDLTKPIIEGMKSKVFVGEQKNKRIEEKNRRNDDTSAKREEFKAALKEALAESCAESILKSKIQKEKIIKEVELKGGIIKEVDINANNFKVNSAIFEKLYSENIFKNYCVEKKVVSRNSSALETK